MGGWQRLWVVISGLLFVIVGCLAFELLPSATDVPDSSEILASLSAGARAQIATVGEASGAQVTMLNGHVIPLKKGIDAQRSTLALAEYHAAVQNRLRYKRATFIGKAFVIWLCLCALIYALGASLGWVYRGFKSRT